VTEVARAFVPASSTMLDEIAEQPDALVRLLACSPEYGAVAAEMRRRAAPYIRLVGHGSSDNAASYGVYAFGLLPGWTAGRDSISLTVYYGADIDVSGSCVVALSQSGETPDVVEYVERARSRGAFTVGVTNDVGSSLAHAAEAVLPLAAGPERAVAATKTYTAQLAALALLAGHAAERGGEIVDAIRSAADAMRETIAVLESKVVELSVPFAYVGRMFVIGRGPEFATARELSLKLLETCRVAAEPLTATDLVHGPVAALDTLFPIWAIASDEQSLPAVVEAARRAQEVGATLVACGSLAGRLERPDYLLPVPETTLPILAPLVSIVPGQLFAWALARAKGLDPDRPVGLSKITLAP
jgi:glucosamine--fructose-6-phosphate aminotransferase (isomerizing)